MLTADEDKVAPVVVHYAGAGQVADARLVALRPQQAGLFGRTTLNVD